MGGGLILEANFFQGLQGAFFFFQFGVKLVFLKNFFPGHFIAKGKRFPLLFFNFSPKAVLGGPNQKQIGQQGAKNPTGFRKIPGGAGRKKKKKKPPLPKNPPYFWLWVFPFNIGKKSLGNN